MPFGLGQPEDFMAFLDIWSALYRCEDDVRDMFDCE